MQDYNSQGHASLVAQGEKFIDLMRQPEALIVDDEQFAEVSFAGVLIAIELSTDNEHADLIERMYGAFATTEALRTPYAV